MRTIKVFFINTALLAGTGFILRAFGMWFNVYLSDCIGADGMGIFSLVMNVYMFGLSGAFAGAGFASTRLVAEEFALGSSRGAHSSVKRCVAYCLVCSSVVCVCIFWSAGYICDVFIKELECINSLKILALSIPVVSISSVLRGYFNATEKSGIICGADIFGNAIRFLCTFLYFEILKPTGISDAFIGITGSMIISEVISFFLLFIIYCISKRRCIKTGYCHGLWRRLFKIAIPVAVSGFVKSGLSSFNQMLIPEGLIQSGLNKNSAMKIYGTVRGMVFPLLMFPSSVLSAASSVIVPEMAKLYTTGKENKIFLSVNKIFYFTAHFAVFVSFVLVLFSTQFGKILYQSKEAGVYTAYLAPLVTIMYFDEVVDGILKGIDKQTGVVFVSIIDMLVCIALAIFVIPRSGVVGYIISLYISELLNGFLSIGLLIKTLNIKLNIFKLFVLPFFVAGLSYLVIMPFKQADLTLKIITMFVIYVLIGKILFKLYDLKKKNYIDIKK